MFNLAPEIRAYHELAMTHPYWEDFIIRKSDAGLIVGDIGTCQYFPNAAIADSVKVFINRDPFVCRDQCEQATKIKIPDEDVNKWVYLRKQWSEIWNPMVFEFNDLFKIETLSSLWEYLMPCGPSFPTTKVVQLLRMNIQLQEPIKALSDPNAAKRLAELL